METIELKQSVTIKNILLATDFSEVSKKALPYAAAIAGKYGSRICPVGHAPIHKQYRFLRAINLLLSPSAEEARPASQDGLYRANKSGNIRCLV
jgi:nucleotide-binding universal stress UspA family protein